MTAPRVQPRRLWNALLARLAGKWPRLSQRLVDGYRPRESTGGIPWTPMRKPLSQCRIAVVTTAGVHHRGQAPFDMRDRNGDPSFRVLDAGSIAEDYTITHDYYDHRDAVRDLNIVLPLSHLADLQASGCIAQAAPRHLSFMGHIDGPHIRTLVEQTAPQAAALLRQDRVDAVLLTPA